MNTRHCVLVIILTLFVQYSHSQIIGTNKGGKSPNTTVKTSDISGGGTSGDVNLFTGAFEISQPLGTVSTPSGLSFSASISHSSVLTSGDNMPNLTGVPYGEGWDINLPTISVSTEDYNKFSIGEISDITKGFGNYTSSDSFNTPVYTCSQAKVEGRLYYFAPNISIPGVASGRFIYKYKDGADYVFVPYQFQNYVEARYNGSDTWAVISDDGTKYEFRQMMVAHRNASNQRVYTHGEPCVDIDDDNKDALANLYLPKTEVLSWYCTKITHPNKAGQIDFIYNTYGCFDFFKAYSGQANKIGDYFFPPTSSKTALMQACTDVFLKEINSGYEKLEFNYRSVGVFPANCNLLALDGSGVTRFDSLYSIKTINDWSLNTNFNNWNRLLHLKSNGILSSECGNPFVVDQTNPYKGKPFSSPINDMRYETESISIIPSKGLPFTTILNPGTDTRRRTGFLESPRIGGNSNIQTYPPGDIYSVEAVVDNYDNNSDRLLFDMNLATGDNQSPPGMTYYDECYKRQKGESAYSTFSQGLKWIAVNGNLSTFEGVFTMPNLPKEFGGFNVQIGPSNSDNDFNKGTVGTTGLHNAQSLTSTMSGGSTIDVKPCLSYFGELYPGGGYDKNETNLMKSGDPMPSNFGIGMPWRNLKNYFSTEILMDFCGTDYWFNDRLGATPSPCATDAQWANTPTTFNEKVYLQSMKLKRYAKNPYMIETVKKYTKNSSSNWNVVIILAFKHDIKTTLRYVTSKDGDNTTPDNLLSFANGLRNYVALSAIRQLPIQAGVNLYIDAPTAPTTFFEYSEILVGSLLSCSDPINIGCTNSAFNTAIPVISKVTNSLGQVTTIEYNPLEDFDGQYGSSNNNFVYFGNPTTHSYALMKYSYRLRPEELDGIITSSIYCNTPARRSQSRPYAFQLCMTVKTKRVADKNNTEKVYNYTYTGFTGMDRSPAFFDQLRYDASFMPAAGFTTTRVSGPSANYTDYFHYVDNALWGRLQKVQTYDANLALVSETINTWQSTLAYEGAINRLKPAGYDYKEYDIVYSPARPYRGSTPYSVSPSGSASLQAYYTSVIAWAEYHTNGTYLSHPNFYASGIPNNLYDAPYSYETYFGKYIETSAIPYHQEYLNSFFVRLTSSTTKNYEGTTPISSITEYEYFDADHKGLSTSTGYARLMGTDYNAANGLEWEPSWQVYKVKTYSPQLPDAYSIEERFYYYDLLNDVSYQTTGDLPNPAFKQLNFVWTNKMRNLPFEIRTSVKAHDEAEISHSVYAIYQAPATVTDKMYLDKSVTQTLGSTTSTMSFTGTTFTPSFPTNALTTVTYSLYNSFGQPQQETNVKGLVTKYTYNTVGLVTKTEVGFGLANILTTTIAYNTNNTIASVTDPNGKVDSYEYDPFLRLRKSKRNGVVIAEYTYNNWTNNTNLTFQQRAQQNYVQTKYYTNATTSWIDKSFVDPLGRKAGTVRDGIVLEENVYNLLDQPYISRKPYTGTQPTIDPPANPQNEAQTTFDIYPRSRVDKSSKYGNSITTGPLVDYGYGVITYTNFISQAVDAALSAIAPTMLKSGSTYIFSTALDEDYKLITNYTNAAGQTIATKKPGGLPSYATTLFKYDSYGNLTKVADPDGNVSTYLYNYLNLLYQKTTPDEGTVKYAYNEAGELIAIQTSDNVIRVMNYDVFGRVISQQIVPSTYSSSIFANSGLPWLFALSAWNTTFSGILNDANNKKEKLWYYDSYSTTTSTTIASNANKYLTLSPTKTKGRVAQSISYDHNNNKAVEYRFFAYDNDGFLKWEITQFNETGITSASKGRLVRIDYPNYNLQGASLTQNIDLNCDHTLDLQYSYAYDSQNRLTDVYTSYNGTGPSGHRMVNYTYDDLTRMVKEKRYYTSAATCDNVETEKVTYTYDQRFRLTDISSTSNLFRWQMFYDGNNPAGGSATNFSNNYNGNINATVVTYGTAGASNPPTTGFAGPTIYNYKYDAMNRLTMADATLQYASPALANEALLGDETYTYDDPGNILSLSRGEISGTTISTVNYAYNYALATNNRLTSMNKNGVLDRTITYDNNGCLLSDTKRAVTAVTIGRANLPFKITMGANNTLYLYDINDQRIYKKQSNNTANVEYYIRNAGGQELGVFKMNNNQLTWYVAGGERVRRFAHTPTLTFTAAAATTWLGSTSTTLDPFTDPLSAPSALKITNAFSYLYDHLGNTRVVYTASFNCATPTTQTRTLELMSDYYPFGKVLRAFDPAPADEKYLMTQKERDSETGLDYFGARYYDSDVCRWLSVDPLADKYPGWSVYNYVLGNPVMLIDPNGAGVDNTIFVDHQGNELLRTEDGLDDAIVVVDDPYGLFSINGSYYSQNGYTDAEVRMLRNYGFNYMVDGMKELLAISLSKTAQGGGLDYLDKNQMKVKLHPEYSTGMKVEGNIVKLKIDEAHSIDSPGESNNSLFELMAHTHPDGFRLDIKFVRDKSGSSLWPVTTPFGGSPGAPPSRQDNKNSIFKRSWEGNGTSGHTRFEGLYDVIVSPTKIHLFNGTTTISVPLSFF